MPAVTTGPAADRGRHLLFLATPALWPSWPFLPLVRRRPGGAEELGLLFDAAAAGVPDRRYAVRHANLFLLPATLAEFLALPAEIYDSAEAVFAARWRID
jgi:hypothetical protein